MIEYIRIAKRYKPRGVKVRFRKDDYLSPAHAIEFPDGSKEMYVPKPVTRDALYMYLHECAHHHLGHIKATYKEPLWKMEYEAEKWTMATMRREGHSVSRAMVMLAKRYVEECAKIDKKKGRPGPNSRITRWMKSRTRTKKIPNYRKPKRKAMKSIL
jgi:hypothetical protein